MNKINKLFLQKLFSFLAISSILIIFILPAQSFAQMPLNGYGLNTGFSNVSLGRESDFPSVIARIINIILGFLGIIAVLIILYGGFKWMTAAGNDDQIRDARSTIVQGVIGLFVIFAAWGIASFVLSQLYEATK